MRKVLLTGIFLLSGSLAFASPSTTITIPNVFVPNTTIQSSAVNGDFNQIANVFNTHTHTDITQLGTVTTGNWAGTAITTQYGGTSSDLSASSMGSIVYANSTGTIAVLAPSTTGYLLSTNGPGAAPSWKSVTSQVGFGAWTTGWNLADNNLAATDGFVVVNSNASSAQGYTDSANPPTVLRAYTVIGGTCMFPVRKGDYWRVNSGSAVTGLYWLSLGQ